MVQKNYPLGKTYIHKISGKKVKVIGIGSKTAIAIQYGKKKYPKGRAFSSKNLRIA